VSDAFFQQLDAGRFRASPWTTGPWGPGAQHAGPPTALIGRAFEALAQGAFVARVTVEILRPVPIGDLTVEARIARPGRSVRLADATLSAGDEPVLLARAWLIRTTELALPESPSPGPVPPPAGEGTPEFEGRSETDYLAAMEWSFVAGSFFERGPATAWLRMRVPLVEGENPSPLQRVLVAADSASGISAALSFSKWLYVNSDLTVYLHRSLEGEWVCLEAATRPEPSGVGLAAATIFDRSGPLGRTGQSLFVAPRQELPPE
jgi:acyl-coenzyme A thioesterase PaaI-like protein